MTLLVKTLTSQRYYGILLLIAVIWFSINSAQSASNISCTADMNNGTVSLGPITLEDVETANVTATLSYSCTNTGSTEEKVSVCLAANGGDHDHDDIFPRYLLSENGKKVLAFNMWFSGKTLWGDRNEDGTEYQAPDFILPAGASYSAQVPILVSLLSGENNREDATTGFYKTVFNTSTALTVATGTGDCSKGKDLGTTRFPFIVQARIVSGCFISATSDINLGSYSAGTTNITGQHNAINVRCPKGTSYNIGLSPSNNNENGTGIMKGSAGNPDTVAYQLRSQPGNNGQLWGNTVDANNVGNGVSGIGSGVANSHTVYVTVPKTDVRPDNYSDIVSVTLNY